MLGVETALAVAITKLVDTGVMTLAQVLGALSWRPARIAGLDAPVTGCRSRRQPGEPLRARPGRAVGRRTRIGSASRSRNTPFAGWKLSGRVRHTVLRGQPTVLDHEAQRSRTT